MWLVQLWEDSVLDDLLDDQWNSQDQGRLDAIEGFDDNFRTGCTCQEMDMASFVDRVQYLEGQTIHVSHWQHADNIITRMNEWKIVVSELGIAPEATEWDHDPFRVAGCA